MVDAAGTSAFTYASGGELFTEDGPFASDTDASRLRTGLGLQQPSGYWTNAFTYDGSRRLTAVGSPAGRSGYTYDPVRQGLMVNLSLPSTSIITNRYDGNARLLSTLLDNSSGTALDASTYGYNVGSQRVAATNAWSAHVLYTYDPIGQLKSAFSTTNSEN